MAVAMESLADLVAAAPWRGWGPPVRVRIDHAPVAVFARAVHDHSALYQSESAARDAGFDAIPAPPTFSFVMTHAGSFADLQPPDGRGSLYAGSGESDTTMMAGPGLYLHGEQHFEYHRPLRVGDVLEGRMRTSAPVTRTSRRGPMETTYMQTRWTDVETGAPVVDELIVSLYFPESEPARGLPAPAV